MKLELLLAAGLFGLLALAAALLGTWPVNLLAVVLGALAVLCLGEFLLLWQRSVVADRWRGLMAVALVVFAVLLSPGPALAAGTEIPLGPIFGDVRSMLEIVLAGVASLALTWLGYLAHRYLHVAIDAQMRDALQSAMVNGIHGVLDRLQAGADTTSVDLRSRIVVDAIPYVRDFATEAVTHFGLKTEDLRTLLRPQLARLLPPPDTAGNVPPST